VCLIIGEPVASLFAAQHPGRSRRISREEAVQVIRSEHERGHVHHAFFKDALVGRFYAICNCCSCCCGPMEYWRHGTPMLASSGYIARVDVDACKYCGRCRDACQFGAVSVGAGKPTVDEAQCMGCGVCVSRCDNGALALVREPARGEPLEIRELLRSD
jgi:ferredoxin